MAKRFNARKGRGDRKPRTPRNEGPTYKGQVVEPGSRARRGPRRRTRQRWVDPLGGEHRTRREAKVIADQFGHEPGDVQPELRHIRQPLGWVEVDERVCDL